MANRYISLPDELNTKLKEEKNVSGLIQDLLGNHYKYHKILTTKDVEEQLELVKQKKEELFNPLHDEEIKLLEIKNQLERDEIEKEVKQRKEIDKKIIHDFVMNISEEQEEEYRKGLNKTWRSYSEYAKEKINL